jgi:hypothetical protein
VQVTGPPLVAGPHAPATSTPPRSPGSVRRTTSIDTLRPDGPHGALVVDARGRDLGTGRDTANPADVRREVALTLRLEAASHSQVGVQADGHAADLPNLRDTGRRATPSGPAAPPLASPGGDPQAWHAMAPLPPGATRRRRRLDVLAPGPDGLHAIDVHFRDSHVDEEGHETVVHEYAVGGSIDARRRRIVDLWAKALVLPWAECPAAVASAERLRGTTFEDLRLRVRRELVGTASCTHLNDTLHSLADLSALLGHTAPVLR